jgi:hypothetical protein
LPNSATGSSTPTPDYVRRHSSSSDLTYQLSAHDSRAHSGSSMRGNASHLLEPGQPRRPREAAKPHAGAAFRFPARRRGTYFQLALTAPVKRGWTPDRGLKALAASSGIPWRSWPCRSWPWRSWLLARREDAHACPAPMPRQRHGLDPGLDPGRRSADGTSPGTFHCSAEPPGDRKPRASLERRQLPLPLRLDPSGIRSGSSRVVRNERNHE